MCHLAPADDDKNTSYVSFFCMVFPTSPVAKMIPGADALDRIGTLRDPG